MGIFRFSFLATASGFRWRCAHDRADASPANRISRFPLASKPFPKEGSLEIRLGLSAASVPTHCKKKGKKNVSYASLLITWPIQVAIFPSSAALASPPLHHQQFLEYHR